MSAVKTLCVSGGGGVKGRERERERNSDRESKRGESLFTGCHSRLVSVKERKQSLSDRCLLTGLSTSMPLTLTGKNFIVPEKEHN